MKRIGLILDKAIGRETILRTARAQHVLRDWPEIVGPAMAERTWPERYEKGTVWVAVQGSAWAQELRMNADRILEKLNASTKDEGMFTHLRFGVRAIERPVPKHDRGDERGYRETLEPLSIREIAEQRLGRWVDEGRV